MPVYTLIRHGQASFGHENYDRLSELGVKQCFWLGEHFFSIGKKFDSAIIGSMYRHEQSMSSFIDGYGRNIPYIVDDRLDEYSFQTLIDKYREIDPTNFQVSDNPKRDYYENIKRALGFWMESVIDSDGEKSWKCFRSSVEESFYNLTGKNGKRTLILSSGGPISVVIASLMGLKNDTLLSMMLQIKNSSYSTILYNGNDFTLDGFNAVSHLNTSSRKSYITFT